MLPAALLWLLLAGSPPLPESRVTVDNTADDPLATSAPPAGAESLIRELVLANLPREYVNAKHWGMTTRRWNGVDVSLDGLRVKTHRRWKDVNHGTWTQYRAWLIDPERELEMRLANLRSATNSQGAALDITLEARLGATGRLSEWNHGLQLYSFHADAEGRVRLQLSCEFAVTLDATHVPPDFRLVPRVTQAKLDLPEFRLQRISSADGPLVHKLGDRLRDDVEREVNERQQAIVDKLNRALDKNRDKLRFSAHDLFAEGWAKLFPSARPPVRDGTP